MRIVSINNFFDKNKAWYYKVSSLEESVMVLNYLNQKRFIWCTNEKANKYIPTIKKYPYYLEYSEGTLSFSRSLPDKSYSFLHKFLNF